MKKKKKKPTITANTVFTTMTEVKGWLKKATEYWEIGYNGDYGKSAELSVIATAIRNTYEVGVIKERLLLETERVIFRQLLLLAHCPKCCKTLGKECNFD